MRTAVIIPARLESTRFPEKMLAKVDKTMNLIQRVHHWCCCFHDKEDVYVATDSKRVGQSLGRAVVDGLEHGLEDVWCGDIAKDFRDRFRRDPKVLEREMTMGEDGA